MKDYKLSHEEEQAIEENLSAFYQKQCKSVRAIAIVMGFSMLFGLVIVLLTAIVAICNSKFNYLDLIIEIFLFIIMVLFPIFVVIYLWKETVIFKIALNKLKQGELECFTATLKFADINRNRQFCFYIEGCEKPIQCYNDRHYNRANKGGDILIVHLDKKKYAGYLLRDLLVI